MTRQMDEKAYAKALWERLKQDAGNLSGVIGAGYDSKKLTLDEKLAIWNDRALSVEEEWNLWRRGRTPESIALGEKPMSPEEISLKVFPKREQLVKSGGNVEPSMWVKAANELAQEAEKRRRVQQPTEAEQMGAPEVTEIGAPPNPAAPSGGSY